MIEAVFFDAGETILSPQPSWSGLSTQVLQERGHDVTVEQLREAWMFAGQHIQNAANDGFMFSTSAGDSERFWTSMYLDMLDHLEIDDHEAAHVLYKTFSDPDVYDLFGDALPTLTDLKERGLKLGVISNFESWLGKLLDRLEITDLFDVIAISGDLGWEKPDRRIFEWAMDEAGVGPAQSLHVGDSPHFDALPAHELGMVGVLLDRHGRWADLEAPYPVVSTLGELIDLVR